MFDLKEFLQGGFSKDAWENYFSLEFGFEKMCNISYIEFVAFSP